MELSIRSTTVGGTPVLVVAGEIDLGSLPKLYDALLRAVPSDPAATLVVDIDGVYACDDSGLGVLLGAAGRARQSGGDIVVVSSTGPLRDRLALTGFDRAVVVADSVASAVSTTPRHRPQA